MSNSAAYLPKVLLYGPPFGRSIARGYGGGTGGYTRNMETYLSSLELDGVTLEPLFHTVRGERTGLPETFPARMIMDCWRITKALLGRRPDAVHALATYRAALPREVCLALLCRLLGIKLIYDIKAGEFVSRYEQGNAAYRAAIGFVLRSASSVLVEGEVYQEFLTRNFGINSEFFPNFVPLAEVPAQVPQRLTGEALKVLFVGYCYEGKGTKNLLEGCALAADSGLRIELTLIGEQEPGFKAFADGFVVPASMTLQRLGLRPHGDVLAAMTSNDIYCYPTSHLGEGHNNSINEAMMHAMVIITIRRGFLGEVLGDDAAYFLGSVASDEIAKMIISIAGDRDAARAKATRARSRLVAEFTSSQASEHLLRAYARALVKTPRADAVRDTSSALR
jgi:glycosyltransferase involved in cell wall biosynthesis